MRMSKQARQRLCALHRSLVQEMDEVTAARTMDRIQAHFVDLAGRKPRFHKWGMRFNLCNAMIGLAIYRTLCEDMNDREAAVEETGRLVWTTLPVNLYKTAFWVIGHLPDPFTAYVRIIHLLNKIMFPSPGWERIYNIRTDDCYSFDVTRCLYVDYLTAEGAPELVIAMCDLDYRTAELFPPQFYFHRTHCLAKGDRLCDFRYCRRREQ